MASITNAQLRFFTSVNSTLPVISISAAGIIKVSCTTRFSLRDSNFLFPFPIPNFPKPFFANNFTLSVLLIKQHVNIGEPLNSPNRITYTNLITKSKTLRPVRVNNSGPAIKTSINFTKHETFGSSNFNGEMLSSVYAYITLINNRSQATIHRSTNLVSIMS